MSSIARARASVGLLWAAICRHEAWVWTGLVLIVVATQWPVLKGYYYRATDTPAPPSRIEWRTDLDAALLEARRTNKTVLVDFSAAWCPPCIAMKHDVWPDPAVEGAVVASYIPVLIDVDHDPVAAGRYDVEAIPTILVLDGTGRVLRRATFLTASGMVRFLADTE